MHFFYNIAVELMVIDEDGYETHEYLDQMPAESRKIFEEVYALLKKKYSLKDDSDKIKKKENKSAKKKEKKEKKAK